jgi:hypothetical protein
MLAKNDPFHSFFIVFHRKFGFITDTRSWENTYFDALEF